MARVLIPLLILAIAAVVVVARRGGGLVRGMADNMLVSPARPAVGVRPAPSFHLTQACRLEGSPPASAAPLGAPPRALFWYALYEHNDATNDEQHPAELVALLGLTESPYYWIAGSGAPGAAGEMEPERRLRRDSRIFMDGQTVFTATFRVPLKADPWPRPDEVWRMGCLARRFTFPLFQNMARLVVEYREPYAALAEAARRRGLPLSDDAVTLAAFAARAEASFRLITTDLPRPENQPPYPPAEVQRKQVAAYAGEVWRTKGEQ